MKRLRDLVTGEEVRVRRRYEAMKARSHPIRSWEISRELINEITVMRVHERCKAYQSEILNLTIRPY